MGGAFGEVHGAKLTGLLLAAKDLKEDVIIAIDTGGVRLQEANAGESAISEIIRAMIDARLSGSRIIGLIGGRSGCYGGGGIIAACCSTLIVSEQGRISVSGPEVIETNKGVEEFDSRDRALIWRTMGGKHRYLIGGADVFVADHFISFREAAIKALAQPALFGLETVKVEQQRLEHRLQHFGNFKDGSEIWQAIGIPNPSAVPELPLDQFNTAAGLRETAYDAR